MNPLVQQICFMVVPAILAEFMLRNVIENAMLRAMMAGLINAGTALLAMKLMSNHLMLAVGTVAALFAGVVLALISAGIRALFRR